MRKTRLSPFFEKQQVPKHRIVQASHLCAEHLLSQEEEGSGLQSLSPREGSRREGHNTLGDAMHNC